MQTFKKSELVLLLNNITLSLWILAPSRSIFSRPHTHSLFNSHFFSLSLSLSFSISLSYSLSLISSLPDPAKRGMIASSVFKKYFILIGANQTNSLYLLILVLEWALVQKFLTAGLVTKSAPKVLPKPKSIAHRKNQINPKC